jgi:hypothetical protein
MIVPFSNYIISLYVRMLNNVSERLQPWICSNLLWEAEQPNGVVERLTLLFRTPEVTVSNLGTKTGYPD